MPKAKRFDVVGTVRADRTDKVGSVQVTVLLRNPPFGAMKGNLVRSLTVRHAKVSDVYAAVRRALDGEEEA